MTGKQLQRVRTRQLTETVEETYHDPSRALRVFVEGVNAEDRKRILAVFEGFAWLVPTWCHRLWIDFDCPKSGANANIVASPEYRCATITLREDFFSNAPWFQRRIMCHELIHLILTTVQDNTRTLLCELTDKIDPTMRDIFTRLMTEWVEQSTSDIENAICERMESAMIERRGTPARKKPTTKRARAK